MAFRLPVNQRFAFAGHFCWHFEQPHIDPVHLPSNDKELSVASHANLQLIFMGWGSASTLTGPFPIQLPGNDFTKAPSSARGRRCNAKLCRSQ